MVRKYFFCKMYLVSLINFAVLYCMQNDDISDLTKRSSFSLSKITFTGISREKKIEILL